jgi:hypothetical protein
MIEALDPVDFIASKIVKLPLDQRTRILSLLDPSGPHWPLLARELGGTSIAFKVRLSIADAAWAYFNRDCQNDRLTRERVEWLRRIIDLAGQLESEIAKDADWFAVCSDFDGPAEELFVFPKISPLVDLRNSLEHYLSDQSINRGRPTNWRRRHSWLRACQTYEEATLRPAGTSADARSSGRGGPLVRFLAAFSAPLMHEQVTGEKVRDFLRWRQSAEGKMWDTHARVCRILPPPLPKRPLHQPRSADELAPPACVAARLPNLRGSDT